MIHSRVQYKSLDVELWEESSKTASGSQDNSLVCEQPGALRLAVMDGCTPSAHAARFASMDAAAYASTVLRGCLSTVQPIVQAITEANALLFATNPTTAFRNRPLSGYVATDIDLDTRTVTASGAADCEIWVSRQGEWARLFGGTYVADWALEELAKRSRGIVDLHEYIDVEGEVLAQTNALTRPMIGAFQSPVITDVEVESWDQMILASDGARLTADRCEGLDAWLDGLREWELAAAARGELSKVKPFDDVTVIRVSG